MCTICQEIAQDGDMIATLTCQHTYHAECIDTWMAFSIGTNPNGTATCPTCRAPLIVAAQTTYQSQQHYTAFDISTPRDVTPAASESQFGTPLSSTSNLAAAFPWWPVNETGVYHTMTQLPDGRLSIIVDPGAWTNLMGLTLARKLTKRALANGQQPAQNKMETLNVQGVGNGHQQCNFKLICPIAIPHSDGTAHLHKISTPIVEGTGSELPGLLGLRSLETDRAILDTAGRKLYYPGPGEVTINLPPGSITIPLEKAPSGHLVIPIDEYERVTSQKGGTPETSLQLQATTVPPATNASSSSSSIIRTRVEEENRAYEDTKRTRGAPMSPTLSFTDENNEVCRKANNKTKVDQLRQALFEAEALVATDNAVAADNADLIDIPIQNANVDNNAADNPMHTFHM